ncbi:MAG: hypothetical protein PHF21_02245 [Bacilli bacterium]|nr:hypothetical protein [Bacilli bacterium]
MKKIKYLIPLLLLLIPIKTNATIVIRDIHVRLYDTEAECRTDLAKNNKTVNSNATNGYYLSCIRVSCGGNNAIAHYDLEPLNTNVTCVNGNQNPFIDPWKTAFPSTGGLTLGETCSSDENDEQYVATQYATKVDQYNCLQKADGTLYQGTSTNNTDQNSNNVPNQNTDQNSTENPQTGINTYYIILSSTILILSIGLYIINKKNFFKKI